MNKVLKWPLQLGVAGFHEQLIGKIDLFEIDTFDPILKNPKELVRIRNRSHTDFSINISASHYYFRPESPVPLYDRTLSVVEMSESCAAEACILKLNPAFFEYYTLKQVITPFYDIWQSQTKIQLWIDLPLSLPVSLINSSIFSTDPLWHSRKETKYWRIHGWHDTRWIRRYSEDTLKALAKDCVRYKPKALIFAHSQRVDQVLEFSKIYGSGET